MEFIAHRGLHDVFTENTLDAFERAVEAGFDAVEMDVQITADGVCVVHHDEVVVSERLALSIRGSYFETLRAAAPLVPRLDEVLELLAGRVRAYVEVKGRTGADEVAAVVRRSRCDSAVHGFDHLLVGRMLRLLPGVPGGILQVSRLADSVHALRAVGARDLWQWHEFVDSDLVQSVAAAGGRVLAWTNNVAADWRVFEDLGVAGVCTDLPPRRARPGAGLAHPSPSSSRRNVSTDASR